MSDKLRVLWATNLAPPYRLPVWRALSQQIDLRVGLFESGRRLTRDKDLNRGDDWKTLPDSTFKTVEYRTWSLRRGENRHYTLYDPRAFSDLRHADVALLGGWDSPACWQLLVEAKVLGKATVGFHESTLASQSRMDGPIALARARFFRSVDRVVVPGPAARRAVETMGVTADRILTGFNAIDTDAFRRPPAGTPHDGHRFLFVGQFIERKNVLGILRAFATMARPHDRLTFVGRGELHPQILRTAHEIGVGDQITLMDYVPNNELPNVMANHDTLVLASHVEVWGLVVNEALAAGMQAVVSSNCGVAESVIGMPGVFICEGDSDLSTTMAVARGSFTGRISDPPILEYTPERFANVFQQAFTEAHGEKVRNHR